MPTTLKRKATRKTMSRIDWPPVPEGIRARCLALPADVKLDEIEWSEAESIQVPDFSGMIAGLAAARSYNGQDDGQPEITND